MRMLLKKTLRPLGDLGAIVKYIDISFPFIVSFIGPPSS